MTEDRKQAIKDALKPMKNDVRKVIDDYATKASELSPNYPDPHTPVIAMVQMALAQAAVEYLVICGCTLPEAVEKASNTTSFAMQTWLQTLQRMAKKENVDSNQ